LVAPFDVYAARVWSACIPEDQARGRSVTGFPGDGPGIRAADQPPLSGLAGPAEGCTSGETFKDVDGTVTGSGTAIDVTEQHLMRSHPDPFRESVRRLQAYVAAGADVLFAPGPQTPADIEALVAAVAPRPLNLLVVRDIGLRVEEIAALGVRRISVGGALALAAWTGFIRAARTLRSEGSFAGLANLLPYREITVSLPRLVRITRPRDGRRRSRTVRSISVEAGRCAVSEASAV
jgi:hypothetical protein